MSCKTDFDERVCRTFFQYKKMKERERRKNNVRTFFSSSFLFLDRGKKFFFSFPQVKSKSSKRGENKEEKKWN